MALGTRRCGMRALQREGRSVVVETRGFPVHGFMANRAISIVSARGMVGLFYRDEVFLVTTETGVGCVLVPACMTLAAGKAHMRRCVLEGHRRMRKAAGPGCCRNIMASIALVVEVVPGMIGFGYGEIQVAMA